MTAQPLPPTHLLTIGEYAALGEDEHGRTELQEGSLVMSPSPTPDHNVAAMNFAMQLGSQLPAEVEVILDIDVDLELAAEGEPGTARRPDLIIVERTARSRVHDQGGLIRAREVVVVVEFVSAGSRRLDNVTKRAEYADAGIGHYWIIDIDKPVSLLECHLTEQFGYRDAGSIAGTFTTTVPFGVTVELDRLC
jgi:Uma2 family endonuclease